MSGTGLEATDRDALDAPSGRSWRVAVLIAMALLGAGTLAALTLTLGEANRQRDRALQAQAHSYDVMVLAATLSSTIERAEAALGRYVISTDKRLGRIYSEDWQVAATQINRLDQATHDDPVQQRSIARLRRAFQTRGDELSVTARSTLYKKNDQALALYYQAREAPALREIDALLARITADEHALLAKRGGAAMVAVRRANGLAGVLSAFGILLVLGAIALGWATVRALGERAAARAETEVERNRATELEAAVAAATGELQAREAQLRQVQKMQAVGQLTGGIAHDFNNMLAVVLGGLELAKRQLVTSPENAARHIDSASEGAARAAALTRQLLAFSREEALQSEAVLPAELVRGMSDLLDRTLGDGVVVEVGGDDRGWRLRADRHQLENAILNLAVNARDAMDGRGRLTITTYAVTLAAGEVGAAAGEHCCIAVADTGPGMEPAVLERVFEPFFTTKPVGKGTGLGLSQVFALVRQAGGEIALVSTPGAGTTARLYFPRDVSAAAPVALPAPAAIEATGDGYDILVVEDDPRVLAATVGALEELGHRPVACNDPLAAPAALAALGTVDLILSDVLMPGRTGPEMIAALLPLHPQVAVLFVTGFAGEAGAAEFGGHAVLRKPYTLAALDRAVRAAVVAQTVQSIAAE